MKKPGQYPQFPIFPALLFQAAAPEPFTPVAGAMTHGTFVVPLSKDLKRDPKRLMLVAGGIPALLRLERYIRNVPSVCRGGGAPLAIRLLATGGFASGFEWGWMAEARA